MTQAVEKNKDNNLYIYQSLKEKPHKFIFVSILFLLLSNALVESISEVYYLHYFILLILVPLGYQITKISFYHAVHLIETLYNYFILSKTPHLLKNLCIYKIFIIGSSILFINLFVFHDSIKFLFV